MPARDTALDEDVHRLITHAAEKVDEWIPFAVSPEDAPQLFRSVRWFVYSKFSPLGWSPEGRPQTAKYSFDVMWKMPGGDVWSRDIKVPEVINADGLRMGRVKLHVKRRTGHADDSSS